MKIILKRLGTIVLIAAIGLLVTGCPDPLNGESTTPLLTGTVGITGDPWVNAVLGADLTGLAGTGSPSFEWRRDGTVVGTANTYTVTIADLGQMLTLTVRRTGYEGNVQSAPFGPIVLGTGTEGFVLVREGQGYVVTGPGTVSGAVTIPSIHNNLPVIGIANDAFLGNTNITDIVIPPSVVSIGNNAFRNTDIESVTFVGNSQLTSIGAGAFAGSTGIESISIPTSVVSVGEGVFDGWTASQTIYIPLTQEEADELWGEGWRSGSEASVEREDVTDPGLPDPEPSIIFDLANNELFQALPVGPITDPEAAFAGTPLQAVGAVGMQVRLEVVVRDGRNALVVGQLGNTWSGVDIINSFAEFTAGDLFVVEGEVVEGPAQLFPSVNNAGWVSLIPGGEPTLETGDTFAWEHTMTADNVAAIQSNDPAGIRIRANNPGSVWVITGLVINRLPFVPPPPPTVTSVTVSPGTATVVMGRSRDFTATVVGTGAFPQTVTWGVEGGGTGTTINQDGRLTVAANEMATLLTVRATSTFNTSISGTATVTVAGAGDIIFDLANNEPFQALPVGPITDPEVAFAGIAGTPLRAAGMVGTHVHLEVVVRDGRNALLVGQLDNTWSGVDVVDWFIEFDVDDLFVVEGEVVEGPAQVFANVNNGGWNSLIPGGEPTFATGDTFAWEHAITTGNVAAIQSNHPAGIRIRANNAGSVWVITELRIEGNRPPGWIPPGPPEPPVPPCECHFLCNCDTECNCDGCLEGNCDCVPPLPDELVTVSITEGITNRIVAGFAGNVEWLDGSGLRITVDTADAGVVDFAFSNPAFPDNFAFFRYLTVGITDVVNNAPYPVHLTFGSGYNPGARQFSFPEIYGSAIAFTFPMSEFVNNGGAGPGLTVLSNQGGAVDAAGGPISTDFSFVLSYIKFH